MLPVTFVLIQKLRALGEHYCDFASLLPSVRAVRERIDWDRVGNETADNEFAAAFLVLADWLGSPIDTTHALVSRCGDRGRRTTRIGLACRLPRDSQASVIA